LWKCISTELEIGGDEVAYTLRDGDEKADGRKSERQERHLWILDIIRTKGLTRAELLNEIYMAWGVSMQVCRDDLNDLSRLGLIAIGATGKSRKDEDRTLLTTAGSKYLQRRGSPIVRGPIQEGE